MERPTYPGVTLKALMDERGIDTGELSWRTGMSLGRITRILDGHQWVSKDIATRLELALGVPAREWVRLQAQYDAALGYPPRH